MRRKMFSLSLGLLTLLLVHTHITAQASKPNRNSISKAVQAVLFAQRDAWNRGDIAGYMDGYERSATTVFVSGDSVTHGWQTVLEHYQKSYNSREKMGTLSFTDLEITPMGSDRAVVIGSWRLKRANDEPHGKFTLIFRKTKAGWRIVHDHTSSA
jgi:ketosteroid isomerase-like protein